MKNCVKICRFVYFVHNNLCKYCDFLFVIIRFLTKKSIDIFVINIK